MPEYKVMKVTVTVEFTVRGPESYGDAADQAVKPIEAIEGAKITSVTTERRM